MLLIPGTTMLNRQEESLGAVRLQLSCEDIAAIESASAQVKVRRARYPAAQQTLVGRQAESFEMKHLEDAML